MEAAKGCKHDIRVQRHASCGTCQGSGVKKGTSPRTCSYCEGTGMVRCGSYALFPVRKGSKYFLGYGPVKLISLYKWITMWDTHAMSCHVRLIFLRPTWPRDV